MDRMGRRRQHDHDLPPHMHRRVRGGVARYYYGRSWIALGSSFPAALRRYAELHNTESSAGQFAEAAALYAREELPKKAPKTQSEYTRQLAVLVRVFGAQQLDEIKPTDVAAYLRDRSVRRTDAAGKPVGGPIVATREKALLSAVISFARASGIFDGANPCSGIRGTKAKRGRYVTDDELADAIARADATLGAFLELCYLTAQRPGDIVRFRRADIRDGALWVQQAKTGAKLRIAIVGPLADAIARLVARPVASLWLVADDRGQPLTLAAMRKRFDRLSCAWQIRDLRAKAASDAESARIAQTLLGHAAATTTDGYIRQRAGALATPIMRPVKR